jgi:enamine deaminase RidA (YjgF/YER057c/UK114 family)
MERLNIPSGGPFEDMYGYCRAVRVGEHIHVAGTTAPGPDAYEQARAALDVIGKALREAGSGFAAVVRTVTYLVDAADVDLVARAHREVFGDIRPVATLVVVAALIDPSLRVEIEAYAVEPSPEP